MYVARDGEDIILKTRAFIGLPYDYGSVRIRSGFGANKIERYVFDDSVLDYDQLTNGSSIYDSSYTYLLGDGLVTIDDAGGVDTLTFGDGIAPDDLIIRFTGNQSDIEIALKEDGRQFAELANRVVIKNGKQRGHIVNIQYWPPAIELISCLSQHCPPNNSKLATRDTLGPRGHCHGASFAYWVPGCGLSWNQSRQ